MDHATQTHSRPAHSPPLRHASPANARAVTPGAAELIEAHYRDRQISAYASLVHASADPGLAVRETAQRLLVAAQGSAEPPGPLAFARWLTGCRTIGLATGMLMQSHQCELEEARQLLNDEALRQHVDELELADTLVAAQFG